MFSRGHPGKTGVGKCTLSPVEDSKNGSTANLVPEAPLSPELRSVEKRNVVAALAEGIKTVAINEEQEDAFSESKECCYVLRKMCVPIIR